MRNLPFTGHVLYDMLIIIRRTGGGKKTGCPRSELPGMENKLELRAGAAQAGGILYQHRVCTRLFPQKCNVSSRGTACDKTVRLPIIPRISRAVISTGAAFCTVPGKLFPGRTGTKFQRSEETSRRMGMNRMRRVAGLAVGA